MKGIDLMIKQREADMDMQIAEQKLGMEARKIALQEQANAVARKNAANKRDISRTGLISPLQRMALRRTTDYGQRVTNGNGTKRAISCVMGMK